MMTRSEFILALAMAVPLTGVISHPTETKAADLSVGRAFPRIKLPQTDRSEDRSLHEIGDFRGQRTVVHIFAGW